MWRHLEPARTPSLFILGLVHMDGWQNCPAALYQLVMSLFHYMDEKSRFALLKNSSNSTELFLSILVGVCEASTDLTVAARVSHGHDNSSTFLDALGETTKGDYLREAIQELATTSFLPILKKNSRRDLV